MEAKMLQTKQSGKIQHSNSKGLEKLSPDEMRMLDRSVINYLDWKDFQLLNDEQLSVLGELLHQDKDRVSPFYFTIPPFVLGPLPQKSFEDNHFSRQFRWQEIHYSNTLGQAIPSGSSARLLMLHIITSVTQTKSNAVDLKSTTPDLIRALGIKPSYGEKGTVDKFEETLYQLLHTIIELRTRRTIENGEEVVEEIRFPIFRHDRMVLDAKGLIRGTAYLDDQFSNMILQSQVILDKKAVIELSKSRSPAALDLYIWATYANFYLCKSQKPLLTLTWDEAFELFSSGDVEKRMFKRDFKVKLGLVTKVYPQLRLLPQDKSITLWRTAPHVQLKAQ
ncbi:MAG: replication protein RepA [Pseudomonadota bacterium]